MKGEPQIHPGSTDEFAWDASANPLPAAVDVAVIGGGIVGCSTAYYLARAGVSAAVFEKGRIGGEQSGRNWGWVRQQCRSPVELPLMMQSLALWKALPAELGEDIGFRQGGTLYLAEDEAQLAELARWLDVARAHGLDTRIVKGAELAAAFAAGGRFAGALRTPSDGRA
ncbi:MAG TPA: FAD-dependent oxidoreductase, partial [Steroidobacteraceae bacterium]|nr:FAD-dependent oxidoreductase [Steroidobacteraceae bacterium]